MEKLVFEQEIYNNININQYVIYLHIRIDFDWAVHKKKMKKRFEKKLIII